MSGLGYNAARMVARGKGGRVWLAALALLPSAALAEVCDKVRPLWDPATGPATAVDEALHLASTPVAMILLLVTALALRLKHAWVGLAAVCGWSAYVGLTVFGNRSDPSGIHQSAVAEGCIGSPALFIGTVTAICIATILYTAPNGGRSSNQEK